MVRQLPLKLERKEGLGGGPLVSYPQEGENGPRYDTAITTMGLFWAGARLTAIDLKNVVSLHPDNSIIIQHYRYPNGSVLKEDFPIGNQEARKLRFDLKRPVYFPHSGINVDILHYEVVDTSYTLTYHGVVLHLDISDWFCKITM